MVSSVPGIRSSIAGPVILVLGCVGCVVGAVVGIVVGAEVGAVVGFVVGAVLGAEVFVCVLPRQPASMVTVRTSTSAILQNFFIMKPPDFLFPTVVFPFAQ